MTGWNINDDGSAIREKLREMLREHREKYKGTNYPLHLLYFLALDLECEEDEIDFEPSTELRHIKNAVSLAGAAKKLLEGCVHHESTGFNHRPDDEVKLHIELNRYLGALAPSPPPSAREHGFWTYWYIDKNKENWERRGLHKKSKIHYVPEPSKYKTLCNVYPGKRYHDHIFEDHAEQDVVKVCYICLKRKKLAESTGND